MQKYRILSFLIVHILIFVHVIWAKDSYLGSFDFQEFFDRFLGHGVLNAGSIMVIAAFFLTLFFGRFFCGWLCHFGAVQELAWWIFEKCGIKPKTINSRLITFLPIFILFNFYIIPNTSHFFGSNSSWSLSLNLSYPDVWTFLPGVVIGSLTFIVDGFLIVYVLGKKGFCRYVCPWGAFLKLPTSLSTFKVRKTGDCTNCNMCSTGCPIAIDVSYEINKFDKVINSNCTSCMKCIDDCPENALSYNFVNPINDYQNIKLKDYSYSNKSYINDKIKSLFISLRSSDLLIIPICILIGLSLDGLYSMGHMLSFGIAAIITLTIFNNNISNRLRVFLLVFSILFSSFNIGLKYSKNRAISYYKNENFKEALPFFNFIANYYPLEIGKYHAYLSVCYFKLDDFQKSYEHYLKAKSILQNDLKLIELDQFFLKNKGFK
tara:strand:- start:16928 stop:18226 length:1299 start_codon:yes stop_codon:yes gene_type:complete